MLVGLLAAVAHGAVLPVSMVVFGQMINFFVFHSLSAVITANGTILNALPINCTAVNKAVEESRNMMSQQGGTFSSASFRCLTNDNFFGEMDIFVGAFAALALGSMLMSFIQVFTFSLAATRQTHCIRKRFYCSILRQNVAWFDENKAGELNSRLVE